MDERNKDLPLIVSEILIEMHEMKEILNKAASVVAKQQEHTNAMFRTIQDESRKNMEYVTSVLVDFRQEDQQFAADIRRENQQLAADIRRENQQLAADVRQEAQEDRQFMTYSLNKAMGQQQQVNNAFAQRLLELEAKYNGQ